MTRKYTLNYVNITAYLNHHQKVTDLCFSFLTCLCVIFKISHP